jgi:hypothetical protein
MAIDACFDITIQAVGRRMQNSDHGPIFYINTTGVEIFLKKLNFPKGYLSVEIY